ncbi:MAG TPA: polysaccharide biosynthesis/export family protein [Terracidiphilus sp.]|nr:polysaccharide biosynthesis/export family protein [Terracidiphilus sp.]
MNFRRLEFAPHICLLLALCPSFAKAQQSGLMPVAADASAAATVTTDPTLVVRGGVYHIRKGDSIDLVFDLCPEFNQTLAVSPDGLISLKAADTIQAAGSTLSELATSINAAYRSILNNPHVAISLKATDIERPFFIATGQVVKPGKYDLQSETTVLQALTIAGGFTDVAKTSNVILYRRLAEAQYQPTVVNVKKLLAAREMTSDVYMHPGDMLYVPKSQYGKLKPFIPNTNVFLDPLSY